MNHPHTLFAYDLMRAGDETEICDLVIRVFNEFNAVQYPEEGIRAFYNYVNPYMLKKRSNADYFIYTAKSENHIAGMIEVKESEHISLMFVDKKFHRSGVGRNLMMHALLECQERKPDMLTITVNSSPFAVGIYEKYGFCIAGPDRTENGIYYTPMMLDIKK